MTETAAPSSFAWTGLPGAELIEQGLADLMRGERSVPALVVLIGAPRLRTIGLSIPDAGVDDPEIELYAQLAAIDADAAHSEYNALIRTLVSFERAAECAASVRLNSEGAADRIH